MKTIKSQTRPHTVSVKNTWHNTGMITYRATMNRKGGNPMTATIIVTAIASIGALTLQIVSYNRSRKD
jgi:hypothetical protein